MPEFLRGSLAQLPLPEVLKLLASGGQNGRLELKDGANRGEIHLQDGQVIDAETGGSTGEAAFWVLVGWLRGDFDFVAGAPVPQASIHTPTAELLQEAGKRAEEWKEIRKVVPSKDAVFALSADGMVGAVSLQPGEWRVLSHVNGSTSVGEIAGLLGQDELAVSKVLSGLMNAGLLEVGGKLQVTPGASINPGFFSQLDKEFVDIMGPLGPMIIDEAVAGLGERREAFPRAKVAALVECVSAEISASDQRAHFQQAMLDLLKKV